MLIQATLLQQKLLSKHRSRNVASNLPDPSISHFGNFKEACFTFGHFLGCHLAGWVTRLLCYLGWLFFFYFFGRQLSWEELNDLMSKLWLFHCLKKHSQNVSFKKLFKYYIYSSQYLNDYIYYIYLSVQYVCVYVCIYIIYIYIYIYTHIYMYT